MGAFVSIIRNDIRIILRDAKALILLLVMPVLVILAVSKALAPILEKTGFVEPFNIAIVDEEESMWTNMLATQLKSLDIVKDIIWADEKEARDLIRENRAAAAIVLPEGLSDSINYWEPEEGKVVGNSSMYLESNLVRNIATVGSTSVSAGLAALNAILEYGYRAGYDVDLLQMEINEANEAFIEEILSRKEIFKESSLRGSGAGALEFHASSLIAVFIMFSSIPCIKMIAEERKLGIMNRFRAAPAHGWQAVTSKLMLSVVISLVQFGIIVIFLSVSGNGFHRVPALPLAAVLFCTITAAAAFSLFIASFAASSAATDLIANLTILLMAIIGGSVYPLHMLPDICRKLSLVTINRWSAEGFLAVLSGGSPGAAYNSCLTLLLVTAGYLAAAFLISGIGRRRAR